MRDYLAPVNAAQIQIELGAIYPTPSGARGVHCECAAPDRGWRTLQASAFLVSNGKQR